MGGALTPGGGGLDTLATNEFVTAVKDGRVHDATYKTSDGSVSGTYWHDEKDAEAGNEDALVRYTSVYVGTDSLAELMAAHPDVTYRIDTSDSAMLETIAALRGAHAPSGGRVRVLHEPDVRPAGQDDVVCQDEGQDGRERAPQGEVL